MQEKLSLKDGFQDGIALCYLNHWYASDTIRLDQISEHDPTENLRQSFECSWRRFRVPYFIQNFNVNEHTIALYLSMLFDWLAYRNRVSITASVDRVSIVIGCYT